MAIVTVGVNPAIDRILECPDFHVGGHQPARLVARLAAGKAANVSRALAIMGIDSLAGGFVGTEEVTFFHDELMSTGPGRILCRFVEVGGRTRENISILDRHRNVETHLRDRGFAVTPEEKKLLTDRLAHDIRSGDMAVFAGSLCQGFQPDDLIALLDRAQDVGAKVALDASGPALKAAVKAGRPWLVIKPNLLELRELLEKPVADDVRSITVAAEGLLNKIEHVLVSRGGEGALLVTRKGAWSAAVHPDRPVIRTVGCGDHTLAAFVGAMQGGGDAVEALRTAVAVGTARALSKDLQSFDVGMSKRLAAAVVVEAV